MARGGIATLPPYKKNQRRDPRHRHTRGLPFIWVPEVKIGPTTNEAQAVQLGLVRTKGVATCGLPGFQSYRLLEMHVSPPRSGPSPYRLTSRPRGGETWVP